MPSTRLLERIRWIETLALRAWPAQIVRPLGGWLLRRHTALSRRVNSVWPNAWEAEIPLAMRLERVEAFYSGWGQPARFQVCPAARPAELDEILAARGYRLDAPTAVQTAQARSVMAASGAHRGTSQPADIQITGRLSCEWVAAYCQIQGAPAADVPARLAVLSRIHRPAVYVAARVNRLPVAVGRGVLENGWLGIFGMATQPGFRRRGLAAALMGALAGWALEQHAHQLYLQVMLNNPAALKLYAGMGFRTVYHYHYRQQAPAE